MAYTITLKLGGALLDDAGTSRLVHALDQLGANPPDARLVVVHGGGPQLDDALARLPGPDRRHAGLRVTTRAQANVVQATLDAVGHQLADSLDCAGHPAVHRPSIEQRLLARRKRLDDGGDLGRVGTPLSFDTRRLALDGSIPVVSPVAVDVTGPLNVNADEAAACIATATGSDALVLATSLPGVLDAHGSPIPALTPEQARALVEAGTAHGGMQPKLDAATTALSGGVGSVHVTALTGTTLVDVLDEPASAPGTRLTARPEVPA